MRDLLWQMLTGHSYNINPSMWYQTNLILLTIFLWGVFYCFSEDKVYTIVGLLGGVALVFQYLGINYMLFSNLRYELEFPLGRLAEMMPYAVIGLFLSRYRLLEKISRIKQYVVIPLIIVYVLMIYLKSCHLLSVPKGFGYSGIWGIIISLIVVVVAYYLPINDNERIRKLTNYTMGIYCMHRLVGHVYSIVFGKFGIQGGTFGLCILIYVTCYIVSALMANSPIKLVRELVK